MIKKILKHKVTSIASLLSLGLVWGGALWARVVLYSVSATSPLITHFNDLTGITAVGTPAPLIFMGILGTVVVVMNFFIGMELEQRDVFLSRLTAALTVVFAVLLFIAFAAIINVN